METDQQEGPETLNFELIGGPKDGDTINWASHVNELHFQIEPVIEGAFFTQEKLSGSHSLRRYSYRRLAYGDHRLFYAGII